MNKVIFSHNSDDWSTPVELYDLFIKDLNCFDPCPLNMPFDGLLISWRNYRFVYVNPPFSDIRRFVDKALSELLDVDSHVSDVWFLLPCRTDTKWFKVLCNCGLLSEVFFFDRRLKFGDSINPAPFPVMLCHLTYFVRRGYFLGRQLSLESIISFVRHNHEVLSHE